MIIMPRGKAWIITCPVSIFVYTILRSDDCQSNLVAYSLQHRSSVHMTMQFSSNFIDSFQVVKIVFSLRFSNPSQHAP